MRNYNVKIDDMLLYLLKEYHQVDASDALTFFTERVSEMKELEPNINAKSRRPNIKYTNIDNRTTQGRFGTRNYDDDGTAKFYVLRGFYPDSNLPFKMVVVYSTDKTYNNSSFIGCKPEPGEVLHVKVMIGMRPHWSIIDSQSIDKYKEDVSEAILLDQPVREENKIKYKYRNFKCMRPRGMELYREKNYDEKQRENNRISAAKRRKAKKDGK